MKNKLLMLFTLFLLLTIGYADAATVTQKIGKNVTSMTVSEGKQVTMTFTNKAGYTFTRWEVKAGDISIENERSRTISFKMPNRNVTIVGHYEEENMRELESTITYKANSGNGADYTHTYTYTYGATAIIDDGSAFDKTGYTLSSWNTKANGSGRTYTIGSNITWDGSEEDIILYAQWRAHTYTVKYDSNKPSNASNNIVGTMENTSHTYDVAGNLRTNAYSLTGWTFEGWSRSANGAVEYTNGQSVKNLTSIDGGTVTLYAVWKANIYTLTINPNGGKMYSLNSTTTSSTFDIKFKCDSYRHLGTFENNYYGYGNIVGKPIRTGYTFDGWEITSGGGNIEYFGSADKYGYKTDTFIDISRPTAWPYYMYNGKYAGNVTITAKWIANTYTVKYDPNKPSNATNNVLGSMADTSHTYDASKSLRANAYSLTGWRFAGWAETANGAAKYTDKQSVKNLTSTDGGSVTLYAVWTANTYTVKYNANKPSTASVNVSGTMADTSHTYDTASNLRANAYSLTGWRFAGWAETANGAVKYTNGQSIKNLTTTNGGTVTLYAKWTANTYTVKYNSNKPSTASASVTGSMADTSYTYDVAQNLRANAYSLIGWRFTGWATSSSGAIVYTDKQSVKNLTATNEGIVTLYAKWSPNTYTVAFNNNGGSGSMSSMTFTYDVPQNLRANTFTAPSGKHYLGWSTSSGATSKTYSNEQSVKNLTSINGKTVTLYAVWKSHSYTSSVEIAATCTGKGTSRYTCSTCGYSYTSQDIAKLGHNGDPCTRCGYASHTHDSSCYHVHSGNTSSGGTCYQGINYHSHNSSCYSSEDRSYHSGSDPLEWCGTCGGATQQHYYSCHECGGDCGTAFSSSCSCTGEWDRSWGCYHDVLNCSKTIDSYYLTCTTSTTTPICGYGPHIHSTSCYHSHTGSASSGGGCYGTINYHTHVSSCYRFEKASTSFTQTGGSNEACGCGWYTAILSCNNCGATGNEGGESWQCSSHGGGYSGWPDCDPNCGCGENVLNCSVTIDSYSINCGKSTTTLICGY